MSLHKIAFVLMVLPAAAFAQAGAPPLVDKSWLAEHLKDPDLVLLHVGPQKEYDAKHIPGARHIEMSDVVKPMAHTDEREIMVELPDAAQLRAKLAGFGISDDSRIVLYFADGQLASSTTRIVFTLDYLGLGNQTSLLNGGLPDWVAAGKPVTAEMTPFAPGRLSARPVKNMVVDAELVKNIRQHPAYKLVDARSAVYFHGTEPTYKKNGHIPGAVNIPFTELLDDKLNMDRDRVAEVFRKAGIQPGETVVTYCHIGMQATVVMLGARLLGNPVLLYDGAFQDWAQNNRGAVEK
jgi:thiosulfate/3-mercaptopyruvate sulfurtransferase